MAMRGRTLAMILLIDAFAVAFAGWYLFLRPMDVESQKYVRIYVQHSDGSERGFSFSTAAKTLDQALLDADEEIAQLDSSSGKTLVLSADGEPAPPGKCWRVKIDGALREEDLRQIAVLNRKKCHLVLLDVCD